ncbi:substrate-binding domain-containing protein, partial [Nocardioides sp.]|uniref:LacI family DNA-binding transcriptional regulator n=1 Tax=Nocardioides sp. TaxID=35761 RepID=UPI00286E04C7
FGGRPWSSEQVSYVDVDNLNGGQTATKALIERGCRRIGTIAGPADMTAAEDRLAGWRQAMTAAGLADDAVERGDFTEIGGQRAAEALLAARPDLDGLVVASDLMASGALKVLSALRRRVPDDVAVIGYDDLGVAEWTTPPLTTIRQPVEEMAERATRLLLEQVDGHGGSRPLRIIIPPLLVRRDSA